MSSVKKIGKSRKSKTARSKTARSKTARSKSRSAGVKAAKREAPKARKARASRSRTGRSSAPAKRTGSAKTSAKTKARKPARANSRSGRNAATGSRAATLARLKKAGARTARLARKPAARPGRQGAAQSKLPKSAAGASRQPASREATAQKVLSERRAHAEAVMKLRATTGKPQPRGSSSGAQKLQKKAPLAAPHSRPGASAPTRGGVPAAGPVTPATVPAFEARPGEIRLPGGPGVKPIVKPVGGVKLGFKPAEFIVYPAHGVGQIIAIEEQEVAGFKLELFVISFAKDKMILKVPTPKTVSVGMRKLASAEVVRQALNTLTGRARIKRTMWSRRAQEYEAKINSGDLVAIAEVVRDLYRSEAQPEQSYSERQLYEAALDRVAREIAVVQKLTETESLKLIESQLQKGPRRTKGEEAEAEADPVAPESEGVDEAA
jgi:CarD family transcriptional regulator